MNSQRADQPEGDQGSPREQSQSRKNAEGEVDGATPAKQSQLELEDKKESRSKHPSTIGSTPILEPIKMGEAQFDRIDSSIRFHETVAVFVIPSRSQYTTEQKKRIWCDKNEIKENAERNLREYAADGYDWRASTEDDAMYVNSAGERLHPIHLSSIWTTSTIHTPRQSLPRPVPRRPPRNKNMRISSRHGSADLNIERPTTPNPG